MTHHFQIKALGRWNGKELSPKSAVSDLIIVTHWRWTLSKTAACYLPSKCECSFCKELLTLQLGRGEAQRGGKIMTVYSTALETVIVLTRRRVEERPKAKMKLNIWEGIKVNTGTPQLIRCLRTCWRVKTEGLESRVQCYLTIKILHILYSTIKSWSAMTKHMYLLMHEWYLSRMHLFRKVTHDTKSQVSIVCGIGVELSCG